MSNTEKSKEQEKQKETPNVSLCEDMNGHKFDQATFDKLANEQSNQMKKNK